MVCNIVPSHLSHLLTSTAAQVPIAAITIICALITVPSFKHEAFDLKHLKQIDFGGSFSLLVSVRLFINYTILGNLQLSFYRSVLFFNSYHGPEAQDLSRTIHSVSPWLSSSPSFSSSLSLSSSRWPANLYCHSLS